MIKRFFIQTDAKVSQACVIDPQGGNLLYAGSTLGVIKFLEGELVEVDEIDNKA